MVIKVKALSLFLMKATFMLNVNDLPKLAISSSDVTSFIGLG